jgi:hypothetical protein
MSQGANSDLVLSIPAGTSSHLVEKHAIYSCPATYGKYAQTPYMTIRGQGGEMRTLYRVTAIVEAEDVDTTQLAELGATDRQRLDAYLADMQELFGERYTPGRRRFFIFSTTDQIPLPHAPEMRPNRRGRCLLRYVDLVDSSKAVVEPASKLAG